MKQKLINYTNNLEYHYNNKIEYIKQLEYEIDEILHIFKYFVIMGMIFLFLYMGYLTHYFM